LEERIGERENAMADLKHTWALPLNLTAHSPQSM